MLFNILLYLFAISNRNNHQNMKFYMTNDGYDSRYSLEENSTLAHNIQEIQRYHTLNNLKNSLESNNLNSMTKMNILNKYSFLFDSKISYNISKGGLFNKILF